MRWSSESVIGIHGQETIQIEIEIIYKNGMGLRKKKPYFLLCKDFEKLNIKCYFILFILWNTTNHWNRFVEVKYKAHPLVGANRSR